MAARAAALIVKRMLFGAVPWFIDSHRVVMGIVLAAVTVA
jgi:hypothetical protein